MIPLPGSIMYMVGFTLNLGGIIYLASMGGTGIGLFLGAAVTERQNLLNFSSVYFQLKLAASSSIASLIRILYNDRKHSSLLNSF